MSQEHKDILRGVNENPARSTDLNVNNLQHTSSATNTGESNLIRSAISFLNQCLKIFNSEIISALASPVIRFLTKVDSLIMILGLNLGNLFGSTSEPDNNAQDHNTEVDSPTQFFERNHLH